MDLVVAAINATNTVAIFADTDFEKGLVNAPLSLKTLV